LQFGSSASVFNSAADPVSPAEGSADADPETVGWGATTVGTLLRAKVSSVPDSFDFHFQACSLADTAFSQTTISVQANDSGAWLWCSEDDLVIDAIRKVCIFENFVSKPFIPMRNAHFVSPCRKPILQMTHANVGSLLVFDPTKVKVHERNDSAHSKDSVVGIITERGKLRDPQTAVFIFPISHPP
jgi:hypothetical protein